MMPTSSVSLGIPESIPAMFDEVFTAPTVFPVLARLDSVAVPVALLVVSRFIVGDACN